jgi:hypothetical protein
VLTRLRATRVPVGSTLWAKCIRGKCARPPACREFQEEKTVNLLPSRKRRTMRPGSVLEIRIHKPDTRGLTARLTVPSSGSSRLTYGGLAANAKVPRNCQDA